MRTEHLESDLGTAAYLVVRDFRLLGVVPEGGGRFAFRFDDPDGTAASATMAYLQGEAVPAKALLDAQKALKTLLYSQKNGNGYGNATKHRQRR
jgi:hypothetical protein